MNSQNPLAYFGKSFNEEDLLDILQPYSPKRILLVRGKNSYVSCGAANVVEPAIRSLGAAKIEFFDFEQNPKIQDVERGLDLFNANEIDFVLAIGGGSVLDMAKLIRFFAAYSGNLEEGKYQKENPLVPLVAIPTTSGTGAETTHFAVCYQNQIKYSLTHPDVRPDESVLVPEWTNACLPYLTACVGFDAFAQAVESYWSVHSTVGSREYAKRAIELIYPNLVSCVKYPTFELRQYLAEGSHEAGRAIDLSFTTAAHAFSYGITTHHGVPHGHAVACSLAYFFGQNLKVTQDNCQDSRGVAFVRDRMKELCQILELKDEEEVLGLKNFAQDVFGKNALNPPDAETWQKILASVNVSRLSNNPTTIKNLPSVDQFLW